MSIQDIVQGLQVPDRIEVLKAFKTLESKGFFRSMQLEVEKEVLLAAMMLAHTPDDTSHMKIMAIKGMVVGTLVDEIQGLIRNSNENRDG